jgi:uncharacterized protein YecE (DUF72 family)
MLSSLQTHLSSKVKLLRRKGVYLGLTNRTLHGLLKASPQLSFFDALSSYAKLFPVIEWNVDLHSPLDGPLLSGLTSSGIDSFVFRVESSLRLVSSERNPIRDSWEQTVNTLLDLPSHFEKRVILSLGSDAPFNASLFETLLRLKDDLRPLELVFELEHRSWKNPTVLKTLRSLKVCTVQRDIPSLTGFQIAIPNFNPKYHYIRLLGRNQFNWFSKEAIRKYEYDYRKEEIIQLNEEIGTHLANHERVYLIAAHYPPEVALSNILEFAHLFPTD